MEENAYRKLIKILSLTIVVFMVTNLTLFFKMIQMQDAILSAFNSGGSESVTSGASALVNLPAPPINLKAADGTLISLDDFKGTKVLLSFFSTSCIYCIELYPHMKEFSEKRSDVHVFMLSMGTEDEIQAVVDEYGFKFPILAWDNNVALGYNVRGTPTFYLIDKTGQIVTIGGANSVEQLNQFVDG